MAVSDKAQIGTVDESVYGTGVVVTKFFDFTGESMKRDQDRMESSSLRAASRVITTDNWALGGVKVAGSVEMELRPKSQGWWFKHALGGVVTSQPNAGPDPTVYLHTFTPGDLPTSFTLQVAKPDIGNTAQPFTYKGCRIEEWDLSCDVNGFAHLAMNIVGQDEDTATALAVASYPTTNKALSWVQGTITIGGSATDIKKLKLKGKNNLKDDRFFLGNVLRKQPLESALREYTGTFDTEFNGLTNYNRFVSGTEATIVLTFQGLTISGIYKYQTVVTMNVRFDGDTPAVGGPDIIMHALPFKVINNGTLSIKVEYQTTDTTP